MDAIHQLSTAQLAEQEAFMERLLESVGGAFTVYTMYLGDQLGFYRTLTEKGAMTSAELASATATDERYVREWLEQQTVTKMLTVEDASVSYQERKFYVPLVHQEALTDTESLNYLAPLAQLFVGVASPIQAVKEAFKTGEGVAYSDYGADMREGQGAINRTSFLQLMGTEWLPAITNVHERLQNSDNARIADIGCGVAWSAIGIAQTYPNAQVDGIDEDDASIIEAQQNIDDAGLTDRITLYAKDAGNVQFEKQYDLVTAFECIHDMPDPVSVLRTLRGMLKEDGALIIADERVGDEFTAEGNDVEWMMYGWSVLHCLPVGMTGHHPVGTGTVMRTSTLEIYARAAGFSRVEVLPIDNFFFRFYRLHV